MTSSEPGPDVRERLRAALAKRPSLTRAQHRIRAIAAFVVALLPVVAMIGARGIHTRGRPYGYVGVVAIGWCALVTGATTWMLRPGPTALGRSRPSRLALTVVLPASLLAVSCMASILFPETLRSPDYGGHVHVECALIGSAVSVIPVATALWFLRRSDPVRPAVTGAALGAIAASWGGGIIAIQCRHPEPLHVALGHVAPIALMALVGAVVGSRLLSLRWIH
jgi:hypothetical protein